MPEPSSPNIPLELPPPRLIPRDQHPITRKDIDLEALKVLYRLRDAGFAAYLVGGAVRDLYLGKTPKDFDISTDARPGEIRKIFRNSRIIGKRFRLVQVFFHGGKIIEVSTLRSLSEYDLEGSEEVLPANNTFGTVAEDSWRRDLTVNSLFYDIDTFTVLDHVGGVADLTNGIIRIIGDPGRRIRRDPVRIMRAVRHAARSHFVIEPVTWQAITEHLDYLQHCPESRIRDELIKDLKGGASSAWAGLAMECGLFSTIFPFYPPESVGEVRGAILANLAVADRLQAEGVPLGEHFLLALLLLPWALRDLELLAAPGQGESGFNFARVVRERLELMLGKLNFTRAQKEGIAMLLVNLPAFVSHQRGGEWPKWLLRKSYFAEGRLFFQVYQEALGGVVVSAPEVPLVTPPAPEVEKDGRRSRGGRKRSGRAPALVDQGSGGIFGFKKR
ncbi:MAG: poly(A) polymerase [Desulfobulbaceae bacterium]|nr:poly(A) polymerase [Desulfobulbaceae bacterium]